MSPPEVGPLGRGDRAIRTSPVGCLMGGSLGGPQRTLRSAAVPPTAWAVEGRLRTLQAIHAPLITRRAMPKSTVGGVTWAPAIRNHTADIRYTRLPKTVMTIAHNPIPPVRLLAR